MTQSTRETIEAEINLIDTRYKELSKQKADLQQKTYLVETKLDRLAEELQLLQNLLDFSEADVL